MKNFKLLVNIISLCFLLFISCSNEEKTIPATIDNGSTQTSPPLEKLFQLIPSQESGVTFSNIINDDYNYNILNYAYLYNGGGISVGDINNDGLPDLYFSGNFVSNKLYLNKGNFKFEDITDQAGVTAKDGFKTGVTMVDINNDGWLDIYACRTSKDDDGKKDNLLFINNHNNTFTEKSESFGLSDNSNSNHANFFDYDNDGDLDLYILNHRLAFEEVNSSRRKQLPDGTFVRITKPQTPFESDRLFRNDNGKFTDVTKQAGVENSTFGLSATTIDLNKDGYMDIFVANDYVEPDHIYINNRNGTFTDKYSEYLRHSSQSSMGCDIADFNNDAFLDILVLDMVPEDHIRYKELMNVMRKDRYNAMLRDGLGHQIGRNVLQLNNGNETFSEIGQLAGVSNTDWSWGALFADFDNDGWKDIFIGNGYMRDVTDLDYLSFTRDSINKSGGIDSNRYPDLSKFLDIIPSKKLVNYLYKNNQDLSFTNATKDWGISEPSFSNGTAYADLDADGDLDLVVNNIDDPAFIYENLSKDANYLQINLEGNKKNIQAFGANVKIHIGDETQFLEKTSNRGFLSSSDQILHFGLGNHSKIDKIEIVWPNGKTHVVENIEANQRVTYKISKANKRPIEPTKIPKKKTIPSFEEKSQALKLNFQHKENEFDDFNRERLIPHKLSNLGPHLSKADVNGDGREDFFIGGASNQAAGLFIQNENSTFQQLSVPVWETDKSYEDLESTFFDADNDGDLDLYVVSGGNAANAGSMLYQDRLYLNDGKGDFKKSNALPKINSSGACVTAFDYDQDGDQDIFVGGRTTPGQYPTAPLSFILNNDKGTFSDVTSETAPDFKEIGMVSDLQIADLDQDGMIEIILVGEWLPISIFSFDGRKFNNVTSKYGLQNTSGWWNCFALEDIDKDGDVDIIAGNLGENTRIKASQNQPIIMYANDFDGNGSIDPIITYHHNGKQYPYAGKDNLVLQIPSIKRSFVRYKKYARADISQIFPKEKISKSKQFEARLLSTVLLKNEGGRFSITTLTSQTQVSPTHKILTQDFNTDGNIDLLLIGNNDDAETESGVYDASNGTLLLGDGKGDFKFIPNRNHGLWANLQGRDVIPLKLVNGNNLLIISNNNDKLQGFIYKE